MLGMIGVFIRPGHCPEILEISKVILKFTPCPEFFEDVTFLSTPVNGASAYL